jgi:hypothetical protein
MSFLSRLNSRLLRDGPMRARAHDRHKREAEVAAESERKARVPEAIASSRALLAKMVAADQLTPRGYIDVNRFEYRGTLDEVLAYLEQRGCSPKLLSGSVRGAMVKEFMPARDYIAYCDVKQGSKVSFGDSYVTFEYWAIARVSRTVYGCQAGVFEALD